MGFFSFVNQYFTSNSMPFKNSLYTASLNIKSITEVPVVVIAILKNDRLVYNNSYNEEDYYKDKDGDFKFSGPVFKIELALKDGSQISIFYGVYTSDRDWIMMRVRENPSLLDDYALEILKDLYQKFPQVVNLNLFAQAPTRYAYHLYKDKTFYWLTNNLGDDAYYIDFVTTEYKRASRDEILKLVVKNN